MNYFSLFNLPVQYHLNPKTLKQLYIQQAQEAHPDYYMQTEAETQQIVLETSAQINKAYNTLANPQKRLEHILQLYQLLDDNSNIPSPNLTTSFPRKRESQLSQQFLMEMLEINELIEELKQNPNPKSLTETQSQIDNLLNTNQQQIETHLQTFDTLTDEALRKEKLTIVLKFYLEQKYLLRLCESLSNFAPA